MHSKIHENSLCICGIDLDVFSATSSWVKGLFEIPAAIFEIHEIPIVFMLIAFATIASGIVDIPTASAPIF